MLTPSGRKVGRLDQIVLGSDILKCQIIQLTLEKLKLKIVPGKTFQPYQKNLILENISDRLGSDIKVELEMVKDIPLTSSGKFRFIVNHLNK